MSQRLTGPYGTTSRNSPAQSHNEPPSHPPTAALVSACARAPMARHGRPRADPCVSRETGWGGPAAVQTQAGSRQQPHQLRTRQGHVSSGRTLTRRITQPKQDSPHSGRLAGRHCSSCFLAGKSLLFRQIFCSLNSSVLKKNGSRRPGLALEGEAYTK